MRSISIYRVNAVLFLIILTTVVLYYGRLFLIPLAFSILFAMLMLPVSRKLEQWGLNRVLATLACIIILLLFVIGLLSVLAAQAASFSSDLPLIQQKTMQVLESVQQYIENKTGVAPEQQISYLKKGVSNILSSANTFMMATVSGAMGILAGLILSLLYFFFLMWKREKYETFLLRLTDDINRQEVKSELQEITKVASMYLIGRLISMSFLAVFYAVGFSVIGVKNGLLLALVAVIPTVVPYIGAFVGAFFPVIMVFITGEPGMLMPVIGVLVAAQVIDNNIIEPIAESESLDISPLATIIALVLGEQLWGVAGMILFLPMFAILKIVCLHIPALHPYGFLLANEINESGWVEKIKNLFRKKN